MSYDDAADPAAEYVAYNFRFHKDQRNIEGRVWVCDFEYRFPSYGEFDSYSNANCEGRFDGVEDIFYSLGSENSKGMKRREELCGTIEVYLTLLMPSAAVEGDTINLNVDIEWNESPDADLLISVFQEDVELADIAISGEELWNILDFRTVEDQMFAAGKFIANRVCNDIKSDM